jgi:Uma2 family endonuclease
MTTATVTPPPRPTTPAAPAAPPYEPFGGLRYIRKFTVDEYHELIRTGFLKQGDPVELLEGYLVLKMPRSPRHDHAIRVLNRRFAKLVPETYALSCQCGATLNESEPEPDLAVARGPESGYRTRHPGPADTLLLVESSASSLARDRIDKGRIYAGAGIPEYWIVNVEERQVEVYTNPTGAGPAAAYATRTDYTVGMDVPLVLDGTHLGAVPVTEVVG